MKTARSRYVRGVLSWVVAFTLIWSGTAWAVELQPGQPAPGFELTDTQGKIHRLVDYSNAIVVLHFQSFRCPWDKAYQPLLNQIVAECDQAHADNPGRTKIVFLAINSNRTEFLKELRTYHASGAISYPILKDNANRVADAYGAMTTPHIFVINADARQTLAYVGGIEQAPLSPQECGKSSTQYLMPVLTAMSQHGQPPYTKTQSIGCTIKRE